MRLIANRPPRASSHTSSKNCGFLSQFRWTRLPRSVPSASATHPTPSRTCAGASPSPAPDRLRRIARKLSRLVGARHQRVTPRVAVEGGAELGAAAAFDRGASRACAWRRHASRAFARPDRLVRSVGRRGDASVVILAPTSIHRRPLILRAAFHRTRGSPKSSRDASAADPSRRVTKKRVSHGVRTRRRTSGWTSTRWTSRPISAKAVRLPDGADVTARGALAPSSAHALDDVRARFARARSPMGTERYCAGSSSGGARLGRGLRAHGCVEDGATNRRDMNRHACARTADQMPVPSEGNLRALRRHPPRSPRPRATGRSPWVGSEAEEAEAGSRRPRRPRRRRSRRSRRPVQARPQARPRRRGRTRREGRGRRTRTTVAAAGTRWAARRGERSRCWTARRCASGPRRTRRRSGGRGPRGIRRRNPAMGAAAAAAETHRAERRVEEATRRRRRRGRGRPAIRQRARRRGQKTPARRRRRRRRRGDDARKGRQREEASEQARDAHRRAAHGPLRVRGLQARRGRAATPDEETQGKEGSGGRRHGVLLRLLPGMEILEDGDEDRRKKSLSAETKKAAASFGDKLAKLRRRDAMEKRRRRRRRRRRDDDDDGR